MDLLEGPPNYKQFAELFKDIQKMYFSITSCINNNETRLLCENNFKSVVDIEYMELLVNNNTIDKGIILATCINILEQIKNIGIPKNDTNINTLIFKIEKQYETSDCDNILGDEMCAIFKFSRSFFSNITVNLRCCVL